MRTPEDLDPVAIVSRELAPHDVIWHMYCVDLQTGRWWEAGTRKRYPFCSCFKLAVLGAYLEQMTDPADLQRAVRIEAHHLQPGGGLLNQLQPPLDLRIEHLLHLLISHSDGTATDWLIAEIGMPAVQSFLARHAPDSRLTHTLGDLIRAYTRFAANSPIEHRRAAYRECFETWGVDHDYTNARDMVQLLLAVDGVLDASTLLWPNKQGRLGLYPREAWLLSGKGGSLGEGSYIHDSCIGFRGVERIFSFALMTEGWSQSSHCVDHIFGEIAYQLSGLYDDAPSWVRGPNRVFPRVEPGFAD